MAIRTERPVKQAFLINKTNAPDDRYVLLESAMAAAGEPPGSPHHRFHVANCGRWPSHWPVASFLVDQTIPRDIRRKLSHWLRDRGYETWLTARGLY